MNNKNIYTDIKDIFINEDEVADFVNLDNSITCYNKIVSALKKPLKLILFYGKPGSGKTFLLNKIASDLQKDKKLIFFLHVYIKFYFLKNKIWIYKKVCFCSYMCIYI